MWTAGIYLAIGLLIVGVIWKFVSIIKSSERGKQTKEAFDAIKDVSRPATDDDVDGVREKYRTD